MAQPWALSTRHDSTVPVVVEHMRQYSPRTHLHSKREAEVRVWRECECVASKSNRQRLERCQEAEIAAFLVEIAREAHLSEKLQQARANRKRFRAEKVADILNAAVSSLKQTRFSLCQCCEISFSFAGSRKIRLTVRLRQRIQRFSTSINRFILWTSQKIKELAPTPEPAFA